MGIKSDYKVEQISNKIATEIHIENHYLHRKASCSKAYGLIDIKTGEIVGVATYGVPASRPLQKGICGSEYADMVGELTRLWVRDDIPRNAESFLVGNSIKMQDFKILVSYAECKQGHVGFVYQATNWIYTGLSAKRTDVVIDGITGGKHGRHMTDAYGGQKKAKEALGDRFQLVDRPRKHRYIYFNGNKKENKIFKKALKYKVEPYPKEINKNL